MNTDKCLRKGRLALVGSIPFYSSPVSEEQKFVVDQFYSNDFMVDPETRLRRSDVSVMIASQNDPQLRDRIASSLSPTEGEKEGNVVLNEDGSIDFDKTFAQTDILTLENGLSAIEHRIAYLRDQEQSYKSYKESMKALKDLANEND